MPFDDSADEQSEDGELRQSPQEIKKVESDFSLTEEDVEVADDSLDIKPPQAKSAQSSKLRRREHGERSRHKKSSDKHREERHMHRDKHYRDKQLRLKEREYYQKEKDKERYYREKTSYDQLMSESQQYIKEKSHRERKEERSRYSETRKHESKESREIRYVSRENEKHRHRQGEEKRVDRALHDLRERLLSKRKIDDEGYERRHSKESHRSHKRRRHTEDIETALEGESGMYVKEIINLSGSEEKVTQKKDEKKDNLTEKERAEQDQRREKLLEAEREMARLKEQSRLDRERRQDKIKFDKHKEELEEHYSKRIVAEEIISDNSEDEQDSPERIIKRSESEEKDDDESVKSDKSDASSRSRSVSSEKSDRSISSRKSRSRERSGSSEPSRSATRSPESPEDRKSEEKDMDNPEHQKERKPKELDEDLPPYYPAISGCRSVEEFQCLNRIEEGTYGVVYRARDKRTDEIVALKKLKMEKEKEGFPITSLREINTLLKGQHKNIVTVREIVVGSNMDKIFIVMDYVEHDLKSLMETMRKKKQCFTTAEVKCLLQQLLGAVAHLHDNWILHRDLKTSNLLLSHKGILKVGDFGLAREYGSPLKAYTPIVVTLWYRAPELLLGTKEYSTPIDMWSVGCIFAELTLMNAYFSGKSEGDQLDKIFRELGTPNEKIWPGFNKIMKVKLPDHPRSNLRLKFHSLTDLGIDLLLGFLTYDPAQRATAEQALKHPYFDEAPLPIDPSMFPTWPAKSELGQKKVAAQNSSPKPPSGGGEYKKLEEEDIGFRIGIGQERNLGRGFCLKF